MPYWHNEFKEIAVVCTLNFNWNMLWSCNSNSNSLSPHHFPSLSSDSYQNLYAHVSVSVDGPTRVWYSGKISELRVRKCGPYLGSFTVAMCKLFLFPLRSLLVLVFWLLTWLEIPGPSTGGFGVVFILIWIYYYHSKAFSKWSTENMHYRHLEFLLKLQSFGFQSKSIEIKSMRVGSKNWHVKHNHR